MTAGPPTLGTTAYMIPVRPQTHRTDWSAYQRALQELLIGKSFFYPDEVDLATQHLIEKVQTAYSAATTYLPAPTSRRWDLPPRLQRALQQKRNLQRAPPWKETIEQAGEDWNSLHQLCRRLTRAPATVCPLFDKMEIHRYAAKDPGRALGGAICHTRHQTHAMPHRIKHKWTPRTKVPVALVPPLPGTTTCPWWRQPRRSSTSCLRSLRLGNRKLRRQEKEWQTRVRYLSIQIDSFMQMAAQVEHVIHQSKAVRSMLCTVLLLHLSLRAKVAHYKGYIHFRLTYASKDPSPVDIGLRMIVGAGLYVLNDVIACDLYIETVEGFIQHTGRRMYDIAHQGPHEFFRNIALMHERSSNGRPLQENSRRPSQPEGKATSAELTRDGIFTKWISPQGAATHLDPSG
ncbi:hypothetical protein EVAR_16931_1 [Eumeta japonica]|uniref:Uncharacterized protein n=1 Tax=Eumeta variegata TaxID=151549 RepID=A0A4C1TVF2_EUMVA|nr:hypothetical protein EVAR_16931_1 [Eumeta japonica]